MRRLVLLLVVGILGSCTGSPAQSFVPSPQAREQARSQPFIKLLSSNYEFLPLGGAKWKIHSKIVFTNLSPTPCKHYKLQLYIFLDSTREIIETIDHESFKPLYQDEIRIWKESTEIYVPPGETFSGEVQVWN